jgi:dephospho-CoA kinase
MLTIGLTGGIGAGKSLAGDYLAQLGAQVIDSDQLARSVIARGEPGFDLVVAQFGDGILTAGDIDRKKLAQIVFTDPEKRKTLEAITHPLIRRAWESFLKNGEKTAVYVNLIPLLVESNAVDRFDLTLNIESSETIRRERLRERGLIDSEIERRLLAQVNNETRRKYCNYTIENNGSIAEFEKSLESFWQSEVLPVAARSGYSL